MNGVPGAGRRYLRSKLSSVQSPPDHLIHSSLGTLSHGTIGEILMDEHQNEQPDRPSRPGRSIHLAQETIYRFLLDVVRKWPPEEVLIEFKRLFLYHVDSVSSGAVHAVYDIVFSNNEEEFRNTLKRSCYILVNNWDASRNFKPIQELVQVFQDNALDLHTISPTLKRLRQWIENFRNSKDYEELTLFASRYEEQQTGPWISRYTSYLLVPQYVDLANPIEQREAARALSKQLKDRFKFDLAMYIAKSQIISSPERSPRNPTALGDDVLRLIKTIVAKRGAFSYANLANIYLNQIRHLNYRDFKQSLRKYLIFSVDNNKFAETLRTKLSDKLELLYADYDDGLVNDALVLRTCNRVVEYLTTENRKDPSELFVLLLSQGNPMTLVIVLLKLILICKNARTHLEAQIAELIRYYEKFPEEDCWWVVNFLEIFNVTFAIYAENVQYNLIKMEENQLPSHLDIRQADLDEYRIFSQLKHDYRLEPTEILGAEQPLEVEDDVK
ncbi:hypothetical protein [Phormidesmis priestleyi]